MDGPVSQVTPQVQVLSSLSPSELAAALQAQSYQAEQVKREKALEVKTIRTSSGCLEMANVQTIGENLTKKVQESKSACKLVEEALRAQMKRQIEL